MPKPNRKLRYGIVLSGGGARGAYEAGIIHYIRTQLPKSIQPYCHFDILCGSSVGAINTCFLASTAHDPELQGTQVHALWKSLKQDDIYKRNLTALSKLVGKSVTGISKNLFGLSGAQSRGHFTGLLDTKPSKNFLQKIINWDHLHRNVDNHMIDAVSLTATNMSSGKMELFIEKHPTVRYSGAYPTRFVRIGPEHARASAAIPLIFPTVRIGEVHYADGGLRLNTPLSPAIQLGADRLLVIGMHPIKPRTLEEHTLAPFPVPEETGSTDHNPPTLGEVMGTVLNSLFLDRIDYDIEQMTRINRLITWGELTYGKDFLKTVNQTLTKNKIRGDIASRGLKRLQALSIFPSETISGIFVDCLSEPKLMNRYIGAFEKFVLRILDVDLLHGQDFLSYLMFIPEYISRLLELGYEDARGRHDELMEFFSPDSNLE